MGKQYRTKRRMNISKRRNKLRLTKKRRNNKKRSIQKKFGGDRVKSSRKKCDMIGGNKESKKELLNYILIKYLDYNDDGYDTYISIGLGGNNLSKKAGRILKSHNFNVRAAATEIDSDIREIKQERQQALQERQQALQESAARGWGAAKAGVTVLASSRDAQQRMKSHTTPVKESIDPKITDRRDKAQKNRVKSTPERPPPNFNYIAEAQLEHDINQLIEAATIKVISDISDQLQIDQQYIREAAGLINNENKYLIFKLHESNQFQGWNTLTDAATYVDTPDRTKIINLIYNKIKLQVAKNPTLRLIAPLLHRLDSKIENIVDDAIFSAYSPVAPDEASTPVRSDTSTSGQSHSTVSLAPLENAPELCDDGSCFRLPFPGARTAIKRRVSALPRLQGQPEPGNPEITPLRRYGAEFTDIQTAGPQPSIHVSLSNPVINAITDAVFEYFTNNQRSNLTFNDSGQENAVNAANDAISANITIRGYDPSDPPEKNLDWNNQYVTSFQIKGLFPNEGNNISLNLSLSDDERKNNLITVIRDFIFNLIQSLINYYSVNGGILDTSIFKKRAVTVVDKETLYDFIYSIIIRHNLEPQEDWLNRFDSYQNWMLLRTVEIDRIIRTNYHKLP